MYLGCDLLDVSEAGLDLSSQFRLGCERCVAEPIVADHAILVGVGDGAGLEFLHGLVGCLDLGLHFGEKVVAEVDTADVDREIEVLEFKIVLVEAFPGHKKCELRSLKCERGCG